MSGAKRISPAAPVPPIVLAPPRRRRVRDADPLARLARIACALVALTLPTLGIAAADAVQRAGAPGARRANASVRPTTGPAATATAAADPRFRGRS